MTDTFFKRIAETIQGIYSIGETDPFEAYGITGIVALMDAASGAIISVPKESDDVNLLASCNVPTLGSSTQLATGAARRAQRAASRTSILLRRLPFLGLQVGWHTVTQSLRGWTPVVMARKTNVGLRCLARVARFQDTRN